MAPVSSGQLPADLTAADDALRRRSFDCLRDSSSVGQNKTLVRGTKFWIYNFNKIGENTYTYYKWK